MRRRIRRAGLVAGPLLAAACYLLVPGHYDAGGTQVELGHAGRATLALMAWMAAWWLTEAIDIAATALLPLAVLPAVGAASMARTAAPYADELIFLFLGGFLLALAMQRWGLDRRIALVTMRLAGTRPAGLVAGIMLATAVMSMFVSNTATAATMLPIALSVVTLVRRKEGGAAGARSGSNFAVCMMLGVAYAASIGGLGTKVGSPPNGLLAAFVEQRFGQRIDFVEWMGLGLPLIAVLLPATWLLLTRVLYPVERGPIAGARELLEAEYAQLGPVKPAELATFLVFCAAALAWVLRPILAGGLPAGDRLIVPALAPEIKDSTIAVVAGLVLFVIPADRGRSTVLDWETARGLPWGVLILFGGGLSLAGAIQSNGVAEFIGHTTAKLAGGGDAPDLAVVLVVTAMVVFLTELTTNTATAATLLPILAALAPGLGVHPYLLIFPAGIGASCGFMLPVGTPPNALVFGTGLVTIQQMCRAGLWLNLISIVLITVATFALVAPLVPE